MEIKYYKPSNSELSKYIEGYYFLSPDKNIGNLNYYTFPNNYSILAVTYDGITKVVQDKIIVREEKNNGIDCSFVGSYIKPIEVFYDKEVLELTIYFKPFGINQFIDADVAGKKINHYFPYDDFKSFFEYLLLLNDRNKQIEDLENYLLTKLKPCPFPLLETILNDFDNGLSVSESAEANNISRQYLNRLFQQHIGKSPSEYKKIQRFRKAITEKTNQKNLTELSNDAMFYDQSHFIKHFKEITGIPPNTFFKEITTEKEIAWLFV